MNYGIHSNSNRSNAINTVLKSTLAIFIFIAWSASAWAATEYGVAQVEKGELLIIREGRKITVNPSESNVSVNEEDLLRVRPDSRVVLTSREKATIVLGANAVFHVKPWVDKEEKGFARMLFGRFRAAIKGLVGGERFNVKTATATVGVKGTEYLSWVGPHGQTMVLGRESQPELTGLVGGGLLVDPDLVSVAGFGINATRPIGGPDEVNRDLSDDRLDSPSPNDRQAHVFPGQEALLRLGVVTQEQLDKAKAEQARLNPLADVLGDVPKVNFDLDDAQESLFRANLKVNFK